MVTAMAQSTSEIRGYEYHGFFLSTRLDTYVAAALWEQNRLTPTSIQASSLDTPNGTIIVLPEVSAEKTALDDAEWLTVDDDGGCLYRRAQDQSGLMRKDFLVSTNFKQIWIWSFFWPWETVNGTLPSLSSAPGMENLNAHLVAQLPMVTPMEDFHIELKVYLNPPLPAVANG